MVPCSSHRFLFPCYFPKRGWKLSELHFENKYSNIQELKDYNRQLEWIVGKWRSEFSGKVFWPTVPTMTFGEELIIQEAPMAKSANVQFLNFS